MKNIHVLPIDEQETLDEVMNKNGYHDQSSDELWREGVQFGVKWQQERMYSEEEVEDFIKKAMHRYSAFDTNDALSWFKTIKKK